MPIARVSRLTLVGYMAPGKRARLSRLTLDGVAEAGTIRRARISRLTLDGNYANRRARISQLRLVGSSTSTLLPSLVASVEFAEPGALVTVSAQDTVGEGVVIGWSIPSGGAGITLGGSGRVRTFVAPRLQQSRIVVIQATYADQFGANAVRSVSITIRPHQFWFCRADGVMIPVVDPFTRI